MHFHTQTCNHAHLPVQQMLAQAEKLCLDRQVQLTQLRKKVLTLLANSARALGAYEIIDILAKQELGKAPAPITIYRALDFLLEQGFVHRIHAKNAYFACSLPHDEKCEMVFLICDECGCVSEANGNPITEQLNTLTTSLGFKPKQHLIEIFGRCSHC